MYKLLIILGLCFYFTPSKALSIVTKPRLSYMKDSLGFPVYPLTLKEEALIKKDLKEAKKYAIAVLWLIPLGFILFGIGGIGRIVFGIRSYILFHKVEKQIAHYPEYDELRIEVENVKQKILTSFLIMIGLAILSVLIFILILASLGGGLILPKLVGLGGFFVASIFLMLEFFVFKTNKIE